MTQVGNRDGETQPGSPHDGDLEVGPAVGTVLAERYVLERLIGQGGMGWVYRATDSALNRAVAIKILLPGLSKIPEIYARFNREARSIAGLDHPNVVPVFDVGFTAPWHYFVMKLLEGEPLSERITGSGMAAEVAVDIALQILAGLEHLHGRGLIHRDIKPGNVLLTHEGRAVILDFGILRTSTLEPRMTQSGLFVGTPEYVAPEIVRAEPGDARSDLYGLGITLYEMLTGIVPFDGGSAVEIAARRLRESAVPLRAVRPDLPKPLEDVVMRALERSPEARFQSAVAMRDALALAAKGIEPARPMPELPRGGRPASAAPTQVLERGGRRVPARPLVAVAAVAVLVLATFALWPRSPAVAPEAPQPPAPRTSKAPAVPQLPVARPTPAPPAPAPAAVVTPTAVPEPPVEAHAAAPESHGEPAGRPSTPRRPGTRPPVATPAPPTPAPTPVVGAPPPAPTKGTTMERARAALRAGQNAEALRLFNEASRAAPGSAAPLRGLGDAYLAVGNRTAAMAAYRRYLALDPGARDAASVRARLQALGGH